MSIKNKETSPPLIDESFPDRVIKMSILLSLILVGGSLSYMSLMLTVSVATGCFVSVFLYKTLWWTIQRATRKDRSAMKGFFLKISILKYFAAGLVLFFACVFLNINVAAMTLGLSIVVVVVVLKIVSKLLVNYLDKSIEPRITRKY